MPSKLGHPRPAALTAAQTVLLAWCLPRACLSRNGSRFHAGSRALGQRPPSSHGRAGQPHLLLLLGTAELLGMQSQHLSLTRRAKPACSLA